MSDAGEEYVTDTPYIWGFYGDFGPQNLRYVAMLCGLAAPEPRRGFRLLELGCGNGESLATYAACFRESEFHGVDLNAQHVENASRLAREGGIGNLTLHHATFADFLRAEVGEFDAVALHGVYSWVGPEVRREIQEILERKLRPGGYAYVSYNALPGWAAMMPLRQILLAYTSGMDLPSDERARRGLQYLVYLRDHGAAYFANNTAAHRKLDELLRYDVRYVAHEFFPRHWTPFYFEDVASDMDRCGLAFVGSIPGWMNIRDLAIPQKFRGLLDTAPSRLVFETHKSFVLNEMFRRDLYVKLPSTPLSRDLHREWDDVVFGPLVLPADLRLEHSFPVGRVAYTDPVYGVLAKLLLERTYRFGDLCAVPDLSGYEAAAVLHSLHFLCASGQFGTFHAALRAMPERPGRWRLPLALNRALLHERLLADGHADLASPVVGTGVRLGIVPGLFTLAEDAAGGEAAVEWALRFLRSRDHALKVDGRPLAGEAEHRALLTARFAEFRRDRFRMLVAFGILEPA